ncbi:MAG: hypothetical protein ABI589_07910, partial [Burkholderiales bacterium]
MILPIFMIKNAFTARPSVVSSYQPYSVHKKRAGSAAATDLALLFRARAWTRRASIGSGLLRLRRLAALVLLGQRLDVEQHF